MAEGGEGHTAGGAQHGALKDEVGRAAFTPLSPVGLQVLSLPRDVARPAALSRSSIYFRRRRWLRAVRKKGRPAGGVGAGGVGAGGGVLVRPGVHSGGARACGQPCSAATAGIPLDPPSPPP